MLKLYILIIICQSPLFAPPWMAATRDFQKISGFISHNVPAVYDVFASPIKETVGFQGLQKCGWSVAWK
jgi:hypothetical protein